METSSSSTISSQAKLAIATIVPQEYRLRGKATENNNYDDFAWWLPQQFQELELFKDEKPTEACTPIMILRNMDKQLHNTYRNLTTAAQIWTKLTSDYSQKSISAQANLITKITKYTPSIDMDKELNNHQCHIREMKAAFGDSIKTEYLANLLFTQNLPKVYESQRLAAISQTSFDFNTLSKQLESINADRKSKNTSKALQTTAMPTNVDEVPNTCPKHPQWKTERNPCYLCNPCPKCVEVKIPRTAHAPNSPSCPFFLRKGKVNIAKNDPIDAIDAVIDSGANQHLFSNKEIFKFYFNSPTNLETANGSHLTSPGYGHVHTTHGVFQNALHAPDLSETALLSVSQFDQKGFSSIFMNNQYFLIPTYLIKAYATRFSKDAIIKGQFDDRVGLYTTTLNIRAEDNTPVKALMASSKNRSSSQWHMALNHPDNHRLQLLTKGLATGISVTDKIKPECDCDACFQGKSKQLPYPQKSKRLLENCGDLISVLRCAAFCTR
jgi:hypothetical protein